MIIDLTPTTPIIKQQEGEYEYHSFIGKTKVLFNDAALSYEHLVAVQTENKLLKLKLQGAEPTSTVVTENAVLYPEVFPGVDLYYNIENDKLKEDLVIHNRNALHEFSFDIEQEGVTAEIQEDNSIIYKDENGDTVWTVEAPYSFDANNNPVETVLLFNKYCYTVCVIPTEETTYPITLDPTITMNNSTYLGNARVDYPSRNIRQLYTMKFEEMGFQPSSLTINLNLSNGSKSNVSASFRYTIRDASGIQIATNFYSAPFSENITINIPIIAATIDFDTAAIASNVSSPLAIATAKIVNITTEGSNYLMYKPCSVLLSPNNPFYFSFESEVTGVISKVFAYSSYSSANSSVTDVKYNPETAEITSVEIDGILFGANEDIPVVEGQTIIVGMKTNISVGNHANFITLAAKKEGSEILYSEVVSSYLSSSAIRIYNPNISFGTTLVKDREFNRTIIYKTPSEDVYFNSGDINTMRGVGLTSSQIRATLTFTYYNSNTVINTQTIDLTGTWSSIPRINIPPNTNRIELNMNGHENASVSKFTGYMQFYVYSTTSYSPRVLNAADLPGHVHIRLFIENEIVNIGNVFAVFNDTPPEHFLESIYVNGEEKTGTIFDVPARSWVDIFIKGVGINTPSSQIIGVYFEEASGPSYTSEFILFSMTETILGSDSNLIEINEIVQGIDSDAITIKDTIQDVGSSIMSLNASVYTNDSNSLNLLETVYVEEINQLNIEETIDEFGSGYSLLNIQELIEEFGTGLSIIALEEIISALDMTTLSLEEVIVGTGLDKITFKEIIQGTSIGDMAIKEKIIVDEGMNSVDISEFVADGNSTYLLLKDLIPAYKSDSLVVLERILQSSVNNTSMNTVNIIENAIGIEMPLKETIVTLEDEGIRLSPKGAQRTTGRRYR